MKQSVDEAMERNRQEFFEEIATLRREIKQTSLKSTDKAANKTLDEHFHDLSTSSFNPNAAAELLISRGELQDPKSFSDRQLPLRTSQDVILAVMANGQNAFRTLIEVLTEEEQNKPLCRSLIGENVRKMTECYNYNALIYSHLQG